MVLPDFESASVRDEVLARIETDLGAVITMPRAATGALPEFFVCFGLGFLLGWLFGGWF